jgi:hypothetical protein
LKTERIDLVPGGSHVRFVQMHRGIPVYGGRIVVSADPSGDIRMVVNTTVPDIEIALAPSFGRQHAIVLARAYLRTDSRSIGSPDAAELMAYRAADGADHLIYRVTLTREEQAGDWELIIDAESGKILASKDLFVDYQEGQRVQGQGHAFLGDPLSASRQIYGAAGFADNNDVDSDSLTAYRTAVTLDSLTYSDGLFWLRGPYCQIMDIETPVDSAPAAPHPGWILLYARGAWLRGRECLLPCHSIVQAASRTWFCIIDAGTHPHRSTRISGEGQLALQSYGQLDFVRDRRC